MNPLDEKIGIELAKREVELLSLMAESGSWRGFLSSSPLATAVAIFALSTVDKKRFSIEIGSGIKWLIRNANSDGGWGDSPLSLSNLSTTILCLCTLSLHKEVAEVNLAIERAENWLKEHGGHSFPGLVEAVKSHYGADSSFSAPILMVYALSLPEEKRREVYLKITPLPFELVLLPRTFFKILNLNVVSYALPALIAVGLNIHRNGNQGSWARKLLRQFSADFAVRKLEKIQPSSGGFLEAIPLTAFVVTALSSIGYDSSPVVHAGVDFLLKSRRGDGSWAIDSDLAVWNTTLAVKALGASGSFGGKLSDEQIGKTRDWLLARQFTKKHPYTGAEAGGWGWTDLPGAVPDADDTAGALVVLKLLDTSSQEVRESAGKGAKWLIGLQNSDGGIPTFCRGWGKLPFDKSCPDISSHALRALSLWKNELSRKTAEDISKTVSGITGYLKHSQNDDGSWIPLWFGDENSKKGENRVFGTALVIRNCIKFCGSNQALETALEKGLEFLRNSQNADGGWGGAGKSSVEETSAVLSAFAAARHPCDAERIRRGVKWLVESSEAWIELPAAPIGLYFSSLWYYERLYPLMFFVNALRSVSDTRQGDIQQPLRGSGI